MFENQAHDTTLILSSVKYIPYWVIFDGTNDYLLRGSDLTGNADSKSITIVVSTEFLGGDGSVLTFLDTTGATLRFYKSATNKITLIGENSSGAGILQIGTSSSYVVASGRLNILISVNLLTGAANLYVDDVSDKVETTLTNDTLDFTVGEHSIGARAGAGAKLNGAIADLWVAFGQYIDFSVEANRRLFFDSGGQIVNRGADGSRPTGTPPSIFFKGPASTWNAGTNFGTGGDYTMNGAVAGA